MRGPECLDGLIEYFVKRANSGGYHMTVFTGFMVATTGQLCQCFSLILNKASRFLRIKPLRPRPVNLCDYWRKYRLLEGFIYCKMMYFLTCFFYYFQHPF
jgi:hypothetical protein